MLFIYPIYSRVYKCICTILNQSNQTIRSIIFLYYPSNQTLLNILFSCYYFVTRDCSRFITQCRCWSWWRLLCVEMVILGLVTSIIRSTSRLIIASQQVSAGSNHTTVVTMTTPGSLCH